MKDRKYIILTIIFGVLSLILSCYIVYDKLNNDTPQENSDNNNSDMTENNNQTSDETCTFTKTHHIVNLLEDYKGEVPEVTFILVDHFQSHYPVVLKIPNTMRDNLKVGKNYEFIYTIPKNNNYENENEILSHIVGNLINEGQNIEVTHNVSLVIKETDKLGLEQINEKTCH